MALTEDLAPQEHPTPADYQDSCLFHDFRGQRPKVSFHSRSQLEVSVKNQVGLAVLLTRHMPDAVTS